MVIVVCQYAPNPARIIVREIIQTLGIVVPKSLNHVALKNALSHVEMTIMPIATMLTPLDSTPVNVGFVLVHMGNSNFDRNEKRNLLRYLKHLQPPKTVIN